MSVVTAKTTRKGRGTELFLLILALFAVLMAWVLVHVGVNGGAGASHILPNNFALVSGAAAVVVLVLHFGVRFLAPWADPLILPIAVLLNGLGLVMIHRIDFALVARGGKAELTGQMLLTAVGAVLMLATLALLRDHRKLRRYTYLSLIAGMILLLLPMVPGIGVTINGANLWIRVAGFSFQPAELAKIFLAVFFAGYLVAQRDNLSLAGKKFLGLQLPRLRHILPLMIGWLACMGFLAMEKDFGMALLFFGLFVAMLYVATERVSWLAIGGLLTAGGIWVIVQLASHVRARFNVWLHAMDPALYDAQGGSFQIVNGWFGMASGGLFGTGWGRGYPTLVYASNSDFIISSFGEELGLTGLLVILCLYLLFVARAFNAGLHLNDGFGKLLATGLGFVIALQVFVVVGGVTRVIPLTGLALPFLALGGSSLLTNWMIAGLLLRMSDAARRPFTPSSTPLSSISTGQLPSELREDDTADSAARATEPGTSDDDDQNTQLTEVVRL
ncbi:cell division protein FtsW (lipid II flippase) [Arcanobacterium wilhelmae]|uniref:Cell division protein FtsW (Lipid II flippase) n=1 Tax=Arcanobacterium wilhelmae TaxID=1803177 RepID=A0ABT9NB76_9ACTO|nr:FtsW/RodA/SpoVE family cell cycle protein [Arcanobacterium wilhelmae]MDP9800953.1 cell division protein FtsW (lipid II flippase) [Arcanobacterium wilhelmae]WFN90313.1 FtsW/RodA/SpoVE family cell cycle protein [Arcanobacterium wilhelmae]